MSKTNGSALKKMSINGHKVKKWYHNGPKVYSAGNVVTYYFTSTDYAQEEVDSEESCLAPKSVDYLNHFPGWTFVGWREDTTASGSVLSSKIMGDEPVVLYAVYRRTFTLSFVNNYASGGSTPSVSGYQYYNNGNTVNPTVTLPKSGYTYSGMTFIRWALGSAGTKVTLTGNTSTRAVVKYNDYTVGNLSITDGQRKYLTVDGTKYSQIFISAISFTTHGGVWVDKSGNRTYIDGIYNSSWMTSWGLTWCLQRLEVNGWGGQVYLNGNLIGTANTFYNQTINLPSNSVHFGYDSYEDGTSLVGVKYIGRTLQ